MYCRAFAQKCSVTTQFYTRSTQWPISLEEKADLPRADAGVVVSKIAPSLDVVAYVNMEMRLNRNESVCAFIVDP